MNLSWHHYCDFCRDNILTQVKCIHKVTHLGDGNASQRNIVLKESWCSLEVELGSKFRDGNSASSTTGRRPVTRLDLKAVPAWGVSDMWLEQWGQFYSSLQVWKEGVYVCEMLPYSQLCVSCPALFSSYHFSVNEISLSCLFSRMRSVRRRAP